MSATTIKLDGAILKELKAIKPLDQSLTALVRDLLQSEIRHRKLAEAAAEYAVFLRSNPEEADEMAAWAAVPLDQDASSVGKKRA